MLYKSYMEFKLQRLQNVIVTQTDFHPSGPFRRKKNCKTRCEITLKNAWH